MSASTSTWSKTYGGSSNDRAFSLVKTQDGGYALLGTSMSYSIINGISVSLLVVTDEDGNMKWNQTYSGLGATYPDALVQTSDGGYALAGYTYTIDGAGSFTSWFAKTDNTGNLEWNRTYSELGNIIANIIQTSDGGYALIGYTTVNEDFVQAWLAKIDSEGNVQWKQTYGTSGDNEIYAIIQNGDGGYFLGGFTSQKGAGLEDFWLIETDSSGNIIWDQTYGGTGYDITGSFVQTNDGGFALFGYSNSSGNGSEDFMMVKTDSSGTMQWTKTYGGADIEEAFSGIQTADGEYIMTGVKATINGTGTGFLLKTNADGELLWNKTYANSGESVLYTIVQANDGGYAMAGYTSSSSEYLDFWLLKTDENGNIQTIDTSSSPTTSSSDISPSPTIPEFTGFFTVLLIGICTLIIAFSAKHKIPQDQK